ncbi:MAG TPA: alpha/beta fold hydrolase [Clostridia bacterium]|nr:alpha/beta fold hydrolase [Clostridia bacterium]
MQLHFQTYGQGKPLLILHGLLGSLENWQTAGLKLSTHFQVFAVDQRNHGRSPHTEEMNYSVMAEDLAHLMQAQGLNSAVVLGHSMGGKTAMQFALSYPQRVEKLVVVDIAPRAYAPRHEQIFQALSSLDLSRFQTRKQIEEALAPGIPDLATRQFLLKNLTRDSAGVFVWKNGLQEIHRAYPQLNLPVTSNSVFTKPVLCVRGEESDYVVEEDLGQIRALFPNAQLLTIPAAGHWVHAEKPEAFVQGVLAFLR